MIVLVELQASELSFCIFESQFVSCGCNADVEVESASNRTKVHVHISMSLTSLTSSRMRCGYTVIAGSFESHDQKPHLNGCFTPVPLQSRCLGGSGPWLTQVNRVSQACRHRATAG